MPDAELSSDGLAVGLSPRRKRHNGAIEGEAVAVVPLHEFQAPSVEGAQPSVPKLGIEHRVHRQLGGAIGICAQVKHKRIQIILLST